MPRQSLGSVTRRPAARRGSLVLPAAPARRTPAKIRSRGQTPLRHFGAETQNSCALAPLPSSRLDLTATLDSRIVPEPENSNRARQKEVGSALHA